jgi:hypothetical protein
MTYQMLKEKGNQGWELVSFTPLRTRVNQDGTTETEYFCAVFKKPASTPR